MANIASTAHSCGRHGMICEAHLGMRILLFFDGRYRVWSKIERRCVVPWGHPLWTLGSHLKLVIINMIWEATRGVVASQLTRLTESTAVLRHLVADRWPFLVLAVKSGTCGYAFLFMFHMVLTSRKVAGSIPDGVTWISHWHNPSDRTMVLGLTQPLTEMSTRNISWRIKAAWAKGWQPYHLRVPIVLKSGTLMVCRGLKWDCFYDSYNSQSLFPYIAFTG